MKNAGKNEKKKEKKFINALQFFVLLTICTYLKERSFFVLSGERAVLMLRLWKPKYCKICICIFIHMHINICLCNLSLCMSPFLDNIFNLRSNRLFFQV